ncbi:MAG: hypothetical protein IPL39_21520 [Opitutaceae bacterium]|nr:hypothetical protein [Opitutaceae bacterium]
MKNSISALFALATALAFPLPSTSAPAARDQVDAYRVRAVHGNGWEINRGMSAVAVTDLIGMPREKITPEVWVYRGFWPNEDFARKFQGNTLLVTFSGDKVTDLHLVNPHAKSVLTARLQREKTTLTIADIATPARSTMTQ